MSANSERVSELLKTKTPLFFPDTDKNFRDKFRQRWYNAMRKQGLTLRGTPGEYKGQSGSFEWTEERK